MDKEITRICYKCKQEKLLSEFPKNRTKIYGYDYICKECSKIYQEEYYRKNKKKLDDINKQWYWDNKEVKQEYDKEYANSERGKEVRKRATKKYESEHKDEIRERKKRNGVFTRYRKSKKGKLVKKRSSSKRKRNLKFIELFINPFPEEVDVHYHHINNILVIPLPAKLHISTLGRKHKGKCKKVILGLYGLDLDKLFGEESKRSVHIVREK